MTKWRLKQIPDCGTTRGYDYHTRQLNQKPCNPCREAKRLSCKEKRAKNRTRLNEWAKDNRTNGPRAQYEKDASARRRGKFVGDYSRQSILDTYGTTCYLCESEINLEAPRQVGKIGWENGLHFDHVVPISKGGLDVANNVRPAHAYCNQKKGSKCLKD